MSNQVLFFRLVLFFFVSLLSTLHILMFMALDTVTFPIKMDHITSTQTCARCVAYHLGWMSKMKYEQSLCKWLILFQRNKCKLCTAGVPSDTPIILQLAFP